MQILITSEDKTFISELQLLIGKYPQTVEIKTKGIPKGGSD